MTVCDLVSGKFFLSIISQTFGFNVYAADLWSEPEDNQKFCKKTGQKKYSSKNKSLYNINFINKNSENKMKKNRKNWFRCVKSILRIFIRKTNFIYLGEKPAEGSIILSNHVGASAPLAWELYCDLPFRFWGTFEMNLGLKSVYNYLSEIYFYQKKHWKKFWAKSFSIIAAPFANLFYKGLRLIPTYRDIRFKKTIEESIEVLNANENIIIFPEDSSNGYYDNLKKFFSGFTLLAKRCLKHEKDLLIYVSYYIKTKKTFIVDKAIRFSDFVNNGLSGKEIAEKLRLRANELCVLHN